MCPVHLSVPKCRAGRGAKPDATCPHATWLGTSGCRTPPEWHGRVLAPLGWPQTLWQPVGSAWEWLGSVPGGRCELPELLQADCATVPCPPDAPGHPPRLGHGAGGHRAGGHGARDRPLPWGTGPGGLRGAAGQVPAWGADAKGVRQRGHPVPRDPRGCPGAGSALLPHPSCLRAILLRGRNPSPGSAAGEHPCVRCSPARGGPQGIPRPLFPSKNHLQAPLCLSAGAMGGTACPALGGGCIPYAGGHHPVP